MAGLTGKAIAATYHSILKVSTSDNQNFDTTLRDIVDGEDTASSLKLATDKATFTLGTDAGDDFKIYNGTTNIITVEGDNGTVTLDKDFTGTTTATTNGLVIDFDATGITASGQTATNIGLDLDLNSNSPTMVGTVNNTGIDIALTAATSGTQKNVGMNIAVTGADTNYALTTSGGNVGIGVADPDSPLEILNTSTQLKLSYDATNYATFAIAADGLLTITTVDPGGAEADIILAPDGNVGIGTATPATKLVIEEATAAACDVQIIGGNTGRAALQLWEDDGDESNDGWQIAADSNNLQFRKSSHSLTTTAAGAFTAAPVLSLDSSNGNVGIGTETPVAKVDVVTESGKHFAIGDTSNRDAGHVYAVEAHSGNVRLIDNYLEGTGYQNIALASGGGNVGIGTISPDGELEISNDSADTRLVITTYDDDDTEHPRIIMRKADGTEADEDMVHDNDVLGSIEFQGMDADSGGSFITGAQIIARINGGDVTDDNMPCDLEFWTNNGAASSTMVGQFNENTYFYISNMNISGLTASQDVQTDGSKNLVSVSDMNWKTDLGLVDNGLDIVNSFKPRYFKWKRDATGDDLSDIEQPRLAGFFAQEVYDKFPEGSPGGANIDAEGEEHWGLNSRAIIAVMTKAIQELSAKVTALENA